jgi:hypothetical protein
MGNTMRYRVVAAPSPAATATRQVTTMAKKKGVRIIVTMECTEARGEGATPSRYTTQKVQRARGGVWAAAAAAARRAPPPGGHCAGGARGGAARSSAAALRRRGRGWGPRSPRRRGAGRRRPVAPACRPRRAPSGTPGPHHAPPLPGSTPRRRTAATTPSAWSSRSTTPTCGATPSTARSSRRPAGAGARARRAPRPPPPPPPPALGGGGSSGGGRAERARATAAAAAAAVVFRAARQRGRRAAGRGPSGPSLPITPADRRGAGVSRPAAAGGPPPFPASARPTAPLLLPSPRLMARRGGAGFHAPMSLSV